MSISTVKATYGLRALGIPTSPTASGNVNLGISPTSINLSASDVFYAVQALIVGASSDLVLATATGSKSGTTAWTAGSPQVESATVVAASGASSNGNLAVVVSSSAVTGTPLTVNVPLTTATHTTAALIAQAIVDTLNATTAVSAVFTATRATATVKLTRKPTATYTVGGASVPVYLVGDASEFTIPTALGVTGATSTTGAGADAGVASVGCYVVGDGVDFEGNALGAIGDSLRGVCIKNEGPETATITTAATMTDYSLDIGNIMLVAGDNVVAAETYTVESGGTSLVTIVVAGAN